jgi:hypothetical protein
MSFSSTCLIGTSIEEEAAVFSKETDITAAA